MTYEKMMAACERADLLIDLQIKMEKLENKLRQSEEGLDIAIRALTHIGKMTDTEGDEHCSIANSTLEVLALVRHK